MKRLGLLLCLLLAFGCSRAVVEKKPEPQKADRILVEKSLHRMTLYSEGKPVRVYMIALGEGGLAPKEREGDARTPEGLYRITEKKSDSAFHLALRLSYPEPRDIDRARKLGVPPGGNIMIHGMPNGLGTLGFLNTKLDWTKGCIAVTNEQMNEIWALVATDTEVEIRP